MKRHVVQRYNHAAKAEDRKNSYETSSSKAKNYDPSFLDDDGIRDDEELVSSPYKRLHDERLHDQPAFENKSNSDEGQVLDRNMRAGASTSSSSNQVVHETEKRNIILFTQGSTAVEEQTLQQEHHPSYSRWIHSSSSSSSSYEEKTTNNNMKTNRTTAGTSTEAESALVGDRREKIMRGNKMVYRGTGEDHFSNEKKDLSTTRGNKELEGDGDDAGGKHDKEESLKITGDGKSRSSTDNGVKNDQRLSDGAYDGGLIVTDGVYYYDGTTTPRTKRMQEKSPRSCFGSSTRSCLSPRSGRTPHWSYYFFSPATMMSSKKNKRNSWFEWLFYDEEAKKEEESKGIPTKKYEMLKRNEGIVSFCTLIEGVQDGMSLPIFYFLKDTFHVSPFHMSASMGILAIPWVFKPVFAYISDTTSLWGLRRKPWIVICNVLCSVAYLSLGVFATKMTLPVALSCLVATSGFRAINLASLQGLIVEAKNRYPTLYSNYGRDPISDFFVIRCAGSLVAAYGSGLLLEFMSGVGVLKSLYALPVVAATVAYAFLEEEVGNTCTSMANNAATCRETKMSATSRDTTEQGAPRSCDQRLAVPDAFHMVYDIVSNPIFLGPMIYLTVYAAGPNYDDALYYYYVNKLHFSPEFMGKISLVHAAARLVGIGSYSLVLNQLKSRTLVQICTVASIPMYLSPIIITSGAYQYLHLDPRFLALSGELVRDVFFYVQMMPALGVAAKLGPEGLESTVFSIVTSLTNASKGVQRLGSAAAISAFGVTATNFDHLSLLILFCGSTLVLPLTLLPYLEFHDDEQVVVTTPRKNIRRKMISNREVTHKRNVTKLGNKCLNDKRVMVNSEEDAADSSESVVLFQSK